MKAAVDIPDTVLDPARALAASRSMSLGRRYAHAPTRQGPEPPWMAGFGELAGLAGENRRSLAPIEEEFGPRARAGDCR